MARVVRKGDVNSGGGRTLSGDNTFIIDGRPVCPIGTPVSPHGRHSRSKTAQGNKTFILGGRNITIVGNIDTCGHRRVEGSKTFILGENF